MAEPLTPAQVEVIENYLASRKASGKASVEALVQAALEPVQAQVEALTAQVATLQEAVTVLDQAAIKAGNRLALMAASGLVLCAYEGGPTRDGDPFNLIGRTAVGEWESFTVQRGV